jgi:4-azaleucine resistance transporter AzlC
VTKTYTHKFSKSTEFLAGARDSFPLIVGAIPFGIIFGTLAAGSGVSFWGALGMSAFVFAGSSQFVALGLVAGGAVLPVIILTTFVVNLRHLLYSVTLVPHVQSLPQKWKIPLGFLLTDETFMVVINRYNALDNSPYKHWYYFGSALFMYSNWSFCTFLGLTIGKLIPNAASWGLDFAMAATFIGMVIPYLKKNLAMIATALVAGLVSLLAYGLPNKLGLIVAAIAGITSGVITDHQIKK